MDELALLRRQLERERAARKQAEQIAEQKTREIYYINQELRQLNNHLEEMVELRTAELAKAHDEAIQASLIKSQFLANMSHELRTPLNAIIGYSEMLTEDAKTLNDPMFVDDLDKINRAGKQLLTLINDILDLSKIETGRMDVYMEPVDVSMLIQDVLVTVRPLIEQGGNTIELACEPGQLVTDVTKLRQVLINLLGNAAKFTKDGLVKLEARRETRDGTEGYAFRVEDSGIGMTPEQVERLFQPFVQADSSTTRSYGGTGLGLAISRSFCEMLGGGIGVESEHGAGSVFVCWLPQGLLPEQEELRSRMSAGSAPRQPVSILLIDDEHTTLELLRRYLASAGWTTAFAESGAEGLRLARELRPEVICLDILMPSMDGWAVLSAIKNDPELKDIPVVILSMTSDRQLGYSLGAAEIVSKPVGREQLIGIMDKYIALHDNAPVLVVEDDATTSEMMARMLHKEGYAVTRAGNGLEALERIEYQQPQLILLDLMMPKMDGFQFLRELHRREGWRDIPVIVVTAKSVTPEERLRLHGYVHEVMQKGSFDRDRLLTEIRRAHSASASEPAGPSPEEKGMH
ncbi:response regulator [Paenibacillus sp. IB182496]|uniref:Circadian input-output histidine kinase CikA n=1 Tax=Paenibacillus sabuli TaxID=2772509 RepID=A0A927GU51_9BACL|nr:response regulator [Paenibacillus sabuli]MBD2847352.1 response regulator [Paenibacillus sabuli]